MESNTLASRLIQMKNLAAMEPKEMNQIDLLFCSKTES